jgi:dUTP pyrophosphatase
MSSKGKLAILGLVDSYYTGPWGVIMHNAGNESIKISHHDKIAQFVVERVWESELVRVEEFDDKGSRGAGGFGSSGAK